MAISNVVNFFLLLALATSCSAPSVWRYQEMASNSPHFQSSQYSLLPENTFSGLGVQLIHLEDQTVALLNVYSRQINSNEGILWIDQKPIYFKGHLLEGNQKLQLPDAITAILIKALDEEKEVIASIDNFSTRIPSLNLPSCP